MEGGILYRALPGITPVRQDTPQLSGGPDRSARGVGCERSGNLEYLLLEGVCWFPGYPGIQAAGRVDGLVYGVDRYRGFSCAAMNVIEALHGEIVVAFPYSIIVRAATKTPSARYYPSKLRTPSCFCGRGEARCGSLRASGGGSRTTGLAGRRPDRSEDETPRLKCHLEIWCGAIGACRLRQAKTPCPQ